MGNYRHTSREGEDSIFRCRSVVLSKFLDLLPSSEKKKKRSHWDRPFRKRKITNQEELFLKVQSKR